MADKPKLGLVVHSNLARRYAAHERDNPLGHAANTGVKLDNALDMQTAHWAGVMEHLDQRGIY